MLAAAVALKLVCEIALCAMAGQWLLGLLSGPARVANPFYRLLQLLGSPFVIMVRVLSPSFVADRRVPLVAFLLLLIMWLLATALKVRWCLQLGLAQCQ